MKEKIITRGPLSIRVAIEPRKLYLEPIQNWERSVDGYNQLTTFVVRATLLLILPGFSLRLTCVDFEENRFNGNNILDSPEARVIT